MSRIYGSTQDHQTVSEGIRSIARSISVLQAINRFGSLTLSEIAQTTDIPYPTVVRILGTLQDEGLVEREPSRKKYRPTALVQTLSCGYQNFDVLVTKSRGHLVNLTRNHGWPFTIVTRVGQDMVIRDSTSSLTSLTFNNYYPGWRVPLLTSASGRAYVAHMDADIRDVLLETCSKDGGRLSLVECEKIRSDGYAAVSRTSYSANPGKTSSIAVPIFASDTLLASLAIIFFANALSMKEAIAQFLPPLREAARVIGAEMGDPDRKAD